MFSKTKTKHQKTLAVFFIVMFLFFINIFIAYSAINIDNFVGLEDLIVSQDPKIPGPEEMVTVTVSQGLVDIKRTRILWYLDGSLKKEGIGATTYSFKTKKSGQKSTVRVVAETDKLGTISKTIIFNPANVDLLWTADTYTPAFYYGKALPSQESPLQIVAITNFESSGKKINPENLIFEWEVNRRRFINESGSGKNVLIVNSSTGLTDLEVEVVVSSLDGSLIAKKELSIRTVPVDLVFYEESPLYGPLLEKAIKKSINIFTQDVTLLAEPYYFNKKDVDEENIIYKWFINNEEKTQPTEPNKLKLGRGLGSVTGKTNLRISVDNTERVLQSIVRSLIINF